MDLDELQRNIMRIRDLEELESRPSNPYNPSDGMSTDEMRKFIQFIFDQMESVKAELFDAWTDVQTELSKSAPLLAAVLRGSKAYVQGDFLLIDSENDQFFSLMRSEDPIYRTQIKNAVNAIVGRTFRLGPYKKPAAQESDPLQNIINKLKSLEVPGSET